MLHHRVLQNVAGSLRPDHQLRVGALHHGLLLRGQQILHLQVLELELRRGYNRSYGLSADFYIYCPGFHQDHNLAWVYKRKAIAKVD